MSALAAMLAGLAVLVTPPAVRPYDRLVRTLAGGRPVVRERRRWYPAAVLVVPLLGWIGPVGAGVLILVAGAGWYLARMFLARREIQRQERALLEAVAALGAEVRAGRAPPAALSAAAHSVHGPLAQVLRDAATSAQYGGDAGRLLSSAGRGAASAGLRRGLIRLGAAWTVSAHSGAAWSEVIDQVEKDLRSEDRHRRNMSAELAGSRATTVLLAGLPVIGIGLGSSLGAHPVHVLTQTRPGQIALLAGILLELCGLMWTSRIVRSAQENA
ncbi:MAG TPA: type II secretion system F family protein [Mycobacteriales bacterium]|nr:type II secretion system F family protein [Mycobacteriales bacterium]